MLMLQLLRRRLEGQREGGFTLIELMVVVLIIAILIAIAIPTFLGARTRAQDRAAQSNLRNALTAAKTVYTDTQTYVQTAAQLNAVEPSLTFQLGPSTVAREISLGPAAGSVSTATIFYAAAKSASGTCFYISDNVGTSGTTGTSYGKDTAASCAGSTAPTGGYSTTGW